MENARTTLCGSSCCNKHLYHPEDLHLDQNKQYPMSFFCLFICIFISLLIKAFLVILIIFSLRGFIFYLFDRNTRTNFGIFFFLGLSCIVYKLLSFFAFSEHIFVSLLICNCSH